MSNRILETEITRCCDCDHYEQNTFMVPIEEKNPGLANHETKYYAYCEKERKFIIPIRNYRIDLMEGVQDFPDFCKLKIID